MADRLHLDELPEPGSIAVRGELDVATSPRLDTWLRAAQPSATITVDLGGISFIDSSGLRTLIEHHQRLEDAGGRLQLVNLSATTQRLIEIAGLESHLHLA